MPHCLAVRCPKCHGRAEFEFAEIRPIRLRKDIPHFKAHNSFSYRQFQDGCGHLWHGAVFYPGLHGPANGLDNLPEGYAPEQWTHSKYWRGGCGTGDGSIRCNLCRYRAKHVLSWPNDAYFLINYRGHVLWAYDQGSANALQAFLLSKSRDLYAHGYSRFLLHIPSIFKTAKARTAVTKALSRLLAPASNKQVCHSKTLSFTAATR